LIQADREGRLVRDQVTRRRAVSTGVYGARRVHAELTLGLGIAVGHNAVEMLMRHTGLKGLPGNRRRRPRHKTPTAGDLVNRAFDRDRRDRLWVTDITENPTREEVLWLLTSHHRGDRQGPANRLRPLERLGDPARILFGHGYKGPKISALGTSGRSASASRLTHLELQRNVRGVEGGAGSAAGRADFHALSSDDPGAKSVLARS
jgi:hypothetical protein